jgi:hypothetical protein
MLGSNEPQVIRPEGVRGAMLAIADSGMRRDALCTLVKGRLLSPADVDRLATSATRAVINTDRNRWIEYDTPRFNIGPDLRPVNMMLLQRFAKPAPMFVTPAAMTQLREVCGVK